MYVLDDGLGADVWMVSGRGVWDVVVVRWGGGGMSVDERVDYSKGVKV